MTPLELPMPYRIQARLPGPPWKVAPLKHESIECPTAADALVIFQTNHPTLRIERIDWEETSRPPLESDGS